MLVYILLV